MFVINANDANGYKISNQKLKGFTYPDFNQLLLKPDMGGSLASVFALQAGNSMVFNHSVGASPSVFPKFKSVNGTPINFPCNDLIFPQCNTHTGLNGYGGVGAIRMTSTGTSTFRIGLDRTLPAGLRIGKDIFWQCLLIRGWSATNNHSSTTALGTISIQANLLRKNGTLIPVGNAISRNSPDGNITLGMYLYNGQAFSKTGVFANFHGKGSGVLSQDGDLVVVDITRTNQHSDDILIRGNDGSSFDLCFGGIASSNTMQPYGGIKPRPIQISLD